MEEGNALHSTLSGVYPILGNLKGTWTQLVVSPDLPISCTGFLPTLIIPGHQEQLIRAISFSLPNILSYIEPTSPGERMPGK